MRISRIKVNNFKSLVDFDLPMEKFTCLIGLNGSGKSTVLQFLDFLAQLIRGQMYDWYEERGWQPTELRSHQHDSWHITGRIEIQSSPVGMSSWEFDFHLGQAKCVSERYDFGSEWFQLADSEYSSSAHPEKHRVAFAYLGSVLSQLLDDELPDQVRAFRDWLRGLHSLDTLTADLLRQPSRGGNGHLGHGGKNLAAYYDGLDYPVRDRIATAVREVFPQFGGVVVEVMLLEGEKRLEIGERYPVHSRIVGGNLTKANHVNDGLFRVLAIFAELEGSHEVVLLDEIENGINPEIVEKLVDRLVSARQQVMVTTHSPMILNYLDDEVAKKSVIYLYKTAEGHTKAIPFFDIPSMAEKLKVMGPGEVFVDTKLSALADEIAALPKAGAP